MAEALIFCIITDLFAVKMYKNTKNDKKKVKPFLKWAGGKGQLLSEIETYYPFENGKITKYAEPFVGGGAVLFDILSKYDLEEVYISDINAELINTYRIIRDDIDELVAMLVQCRASLSRWTQSIAKSTIWHSVNALMI